MIMPTPQPAITVAAADYDRLCNLAERSAQTMPEVAGFLLEELDRATIAPTPPDTIQMGARARFEDETGEARDVRLVYPEDAEAARGHISVLTPVGAALLGLAAGQSISWRDLRGALRTLTVLSVSHDPNEEISVPEDTRTIHL